MFNVIGQLKNGVIRYIVLWEIGNQCDIPNWKYVFYATKTWSILLFAECIHISAEIRDSAQFEYGELIHQTKKHVDFADGTFICVVQ